MSEAARWYNAVIRDCKLNPASFQLANGNLPLGITSTAIWSILDMVPPNAFENYNPTPGNVFSDNYGAILMSLKPVGLASAALSIWDSAGGFTAVKAYDGTFSGLRAKLQSAPGATVSMRVGQDTTDLSGAWTEKGGNEPVGLFQSVPQHGATQKAKAPQPGTIVDVTFDHVLTFVAGPLSKSDPLNPDLMNYKPWYNSAALKLAFGNTAAWQRPGEWPLYFDNTSGSMLRSITSIVVVDGVTSTTRPAPLTQLFRSDQKDLEMAPVEQPVDPVGFWPFAVPSSGLSTTHPARPATNLLGYVISAGVNSGVKIVSKPGNPLLLGVNVQSLAAALG